MGRLRAAFTRAFSMAHGWLNGRPDGDVPLGRQLTQVRERVGGALVPLLELATQSQVVGACLGAERQGSDVVPEFLQLGFDVGPGVGVVADHRDGRRWRNQTPGCRGQASSLSHV